MKQYGWLVALAILLAGAVEAAETGGWREEFNRAGASGLPIDWEYKGGPVGVADITVKLVDEPGADDGKALLLDSNSASGSIIANPSAQVDLQKTPFMRWRWRVIDPTAPTKLDDQALVIYFGARQWLRNKSIAYRWETLLPVGATGETSYGAGMVKVHYLVLRNNQTPNGEWVTETRNVAEDFKKIYGFIPDEFVVSVGCNSQYTKSHSKAEVDYITFLTPAEAAQSPETESKE